jgi:hypothetical protein
VTTRWRECKLGDMLEVKHGFAFLGEHFADNGTHIVLTPGNFSIKAASNRRATRRSGTAGRSRLTMF